ncbi:hypothetical protein MMC25_005714 [Agyrium rufum]|nr:hypothetical protein [Agyrium rufum]
MAEKDGLLDSVAKLPQEIQDLIFLELLHVCFNKGKVRPLNPHVDEDFSWLDTLRWDPDGEEVPFYDGLYRNFVYDPPKLALLRILPKRWRAIAERNLFENTVWVLPGPSSTETTTYRDADLQQRRSLQRALPFWQVRSFRPCVDKIRSLEVSFKMLDYPHDYMLAPTAVDRQHSHCALHGSPFNDPQRNTKWEIERSIVLVDTMYSWYQSIHEVAHLPCLKRLHIDCCDIFAEDPENPENPEDQYISCIFTSILETCRDYLDLRQKARIKIYFRLPDNTAFRQIEQELQGDAFPLHSLKDMIHISICHECRVARDDQ